ncbi:hypothetical protein [Methylicorpusculum sp.]|uniref:hypothetical protein n=1 Tax=Methylicorpusculum sp. TaxID=2713644 RepID=UPI002AB850DE|nr:hypothetical protein [Methylicorpusculum sp.]MDZ4153662.1 hypothetical protein [Methylicorpusculum sp.]
MAINLGKSSGSANSTPASIPNQNLVNPPSDPVEALMNQLSIKIFESYCDEATMNSLIQNGVQSCGLDMKKAEFVLAMELENKGVANEKVLLAELEALLCQFTDADKKLDEKEKNDAIQFLCKARTGYTQGLNFDVANRFIIAFCRNNRVKMKVGFFKWEIP